MRQSDSTTAPELQTDYWFNTDSPVTLAGLRGRVVLIEAFQMLCPGCVAHGLPQAMRVMQTFSNDDVMVLGLHTVFEHHQAQGTPEALKAFLHEYRIAFPVGIDEQSGSARLPKTMSAYNMQGTPTLLLIDRNGVLRKQAFGQVADLGLGAEIMSLVAETDGITESSQNDSEDSAQCDESGCAVQTTVADAPPIACDIHDYIEVACLFKYQLELLHVDGTRISGLAMTTRTTSGVEYIVIETGGVQHAVVLTEVASIRVLTANARFEHLSMRKPAS